VARLLLGRVYYEEADYDKAIAMYETFLKGKNRKVELNAMAWEGLAYSYEAKKDYAEALRCYEKLSQMDLANVKGWALMGLARCYEQLGELEKALGAYRELLADQPQHPKAAEARASIDRITQELERKDQGKPPA
jgi:tetratricopeptide (TPR) repeat protein